MCGITGFYKPSGGEENWVNILKNMTDTIQHRGPDSDGHWLDLEAGVALGHRRLAIIDLSPTGYQPMFSASERYVIVFNGEIYNFLDLRRQLEDRPTPPTFRGTSDTEVMLAAFETWGVQEALRQMVGMFAFALWDQQERQLYLARDRMGEKPLYYGWMGDTFLFGSELKALQAHPAFQGEINREALTLYMRHAYVPGPHCIYKSIYKLPPATTLCLKENITVGQLPSPIQYWSLRTTVETQESDPFTGSDTEAIDQLETLIKDAVCRQMIADVPLGAFLSGGIDSSTIVSLMQAQSTRPVRTFSIGFEESGYNEAPYAKKVAAHLGTDHTELYVTPKQTLEVVPRLPTLWDEPFADSSQIPTFLVAQLTRQYVTVSLSGDGGDELFAGYRRYLRSIEMAQAHTGPAWQRAIIGAAPPKLYGAMARAASSVGIDSVSSAFRRWQSLARYRHFDPFEDFRHASLSHWQTPEAVVLNAKEPDTILTDRSRWAKVDGLVEQLTYFDMAMYLPDDILTKVDRASMSVSLEARVPFLDHRVVEFSQRLPVSMKIRDGGGKWILRQILHRYVPSELVERPKMGFGVPIDRWLRKELRDWAEDLLHVDRLKNEGFFNAELVHQKWTQHLQGIQKYHIWDVLMFQAWLDKNQT